MEGSQEIDAKSISPSHEKVLLLVENVSKGMEQRECMCSVKTEVFLRVVVEAFKTVGDNGGYDDDPAGKAMLQLLALLAKMIAVESTALAAQQSSATAPARICAGVHAAVKALKQSKLLMLSLLLRLATSGDPRRVQLAFSASRAFLVLLRQLPCPTSEACRRSCHRVVHYLVNNCRTKPVIVALLDHMLSDVHIPVMKHKESVSECTKVASQSAIAVSPAKHDTELKQVLAHCLKTEWKRMLIAFNGSDEVDLTHRLCFLNLWKKVVSVRTNLGITTCKEIISMSLSLVPELFQEKRCLVWRKQLEVLNEVLCYGSTLALQMNVPNEISAISQALLREATASRFLEVSRSPIEISTGFLGDANVAASSVEAKPGKQVIQGITLLLLKACAIVVREATFNSSDEDSDCSLGSSIGENEDARMIGANLSSMLQHLHALLTSVMPTASASNYMAGPNFSVAVVSLFFDQDDFLVEALLCLSDIYTRCCQQLCQPLEVSFDPITLFSSFMSRCAWDTSIVIDFLISNETCFLLYFLRLLKYVAKCSQELEGHSELKHFLRKVNASLKKLVSHSLFPYNIDPVLKLLERFRDEEP